MATFGERLKELRTRDKLTQSELGDMIGLKRRMIQYLESGQREPNLETINKLCNIFHCTTDYLLGTDDTPVDDALLIEKMTQTAIKMGYDTSNPDDMNKFYELLKNALMSVKENNGSD